MTAWMPFIGPYFKVNIPTDWKVVSSAYFQVTFLSPPTQDGHIVNIAVIIFPAQGNLKTYMDETFIPSIESLETSSDLQVNSLLASSGQMGFDIAVEHQLEQGNIYQRHVVFEYQDMFYHFLGTIPLSLEPALLDRVHDVFDQIFASFAFTEQNLETALGLGGDNRS